jgi:hypothetical protein
MESRPPIADFVQARRLIQAVGVRTPMKAAASIPAQFRAAHTACSFHFLDTVYLSSCHLHFHRQIARSETTPKCLRIRPIDMGLYTLGILGR